MRATLRTSHRVSEQHIDTLVTCQHTLLDAIRTMQAKLDAISEAVGAKGGAEPEEQSRTMSPKGGSRDSLHTDGASNRSSYVVESRLSVPCIPEESQPGSRRTRALTVPSSAPGTPSVVRDLYNLPLAPTDSQLRMRPGLVNTGTASMGLQAFPRSGRTRNNATLASNEPEFDEKKPFRCFKAWNPDSRSRTVFDVSSMAVLLYDAFTVPYLLAWKVPADGAITLLIKLFWTVDLLLNLVTGYRGKDARLVLDPWRAMMRYVSTWFLADLILVSCDWFSLSYSTSHESVLPLQWIRVVRLVRSGRQVLRGWTLVLKAKLMINSKAFHLVLELSLFIVIIVWVNHCVCCGWYSIGQFPELSDTGKTWLSTREYDSGDNYDYWTARYDYWTALHWAMTQMTPGSMEVTPKSTKERIYNVSILLLGLLMGSSLVATLTSMLTQYKLRVEGSSQKFMILTQFLTQQGVDANLALAIKLQVKARSTQGQRLRAQDVEYLSLLSNSMQGKLWHSLCIQHLSRHQFLNSLEMVDPLAMKAVCKGAVQASEFAAGDTVFEEGTSGDHMYFLTFGHMHYSCPDLIAEAALDESNGLILRPGMWCCEAALWTVWTHLGQLEASSSAEVLTLSGPRFLSALTHFPLASELVSDYCVAFYRHINEPGVLKTDLAHVVDTCELIASLSPETRLRFVKPVIDRLESHFWDGIRKADLERLKSEVFSGKCDIGLVDSEVVRHCFIVAVKLHRSPRSMDRFLVQLAELDAESQEASVEVLLPGVTRAWRESYVTCFNRILDDDLQEIASHVEIHFQEGSKRTVFMSDHSSSGIRTRYLRTAFAATLSQGAKLRHIGAPEKPPTPRHISLVSSLLTRNEALRHAEEKAVVEALSAQKSLVVLHRKKPEETIRSVYGWLTESEFAALSTDLAKPIIERWLSSLGSINEEEEEDEVEAEEFESSVDKFSVASMPMAERLTPWRAVASGACRLWEAQHYNCRL